VKLKDLIKESKYLQRKFGEPLPTLDSVMKQHKSKEQVNERITTPFMVHPTDPDQTERHWVKVFKELARGHGHIIDYGPRESDQYDWNDRRNYKKSIEEYNKYMNKVADKLNKSLDEMNNIYKVWSKIRDKYRKKDKS
jgi:adenylate kinase family enzyme